MTYSSSYAHPNHWLWLMIANITVTLTWYVSNWQLSAIGCFHSAVLFSSQNISSRIFFVLFYSPRKQEKMSVIYVTSSLLLTLFMAVPELMETHRSCCLSMVASRRAKVCFVSQISHVNVYCIHMLIACILLSLL